MLTVILLDLTTPPGFTKDSTTSKHGDTDAEVGGSEVNRKLTHSRKESGNIVVQPSMDNRPSAQDYTPDLSINSNRAGAGKGEAVSKRRGPSAGVMRLPARPKLIISGPRLSPQDGQAPSAFERPRPPPLILQQPNGIITPPGRSL